MNENAQRWVDVLRSGEYRQCDRALRTNDTYCCLGVGLDILDPDGWTEPDGFVWKRRYGHVHADQPGRYLPAQIYFSDAMGIAPRFIRELSGMNDDGMTFDRIADKIEEHLA